MEQQFERTETVLECPQCGDPGEVIDLLSSKEFSCPGCGYQEDFYSYVHGDLLEACKLVDRAAAGDGVEMPRAIDACLLAVQKTEATGGIECPAQDMIIEQADKMERRADKESCEDCPYLDGEGDCRGPFTCPISDAPDQTPGLVDLIKQHGETHDNRYFWCPGGQQCKLPEITADKERIDPSIYIELDEQAFFVVEEPGNINGSFYVVYFNGNGNLEERIEHKPQIKSMLKNNQDVIGMRFVNCQLKY